MNLSFPVKIARGYLDVVCLFYAVSGVGLVLLGPFAVLLILVSRVSLIVVLPWPLLEPYFDSTIGVFLGGYYAPPAFAFSLLALGIVVIVLGIAGLVVLRRLERDIRLVYFWYFLSLFVFAIAAYNLFVVQDPTIQVMGFVNAGLVALAVYTVHRGVRRATAMSVSVNK
ncbi:hypothetical protein HY573_01175 [Candidatus Parcubacteria bacterium]|nr:hypothetical protein [Candidatus Parcubacteria bacterium]